MDNELAEIEAFDGANELTEVEEFDYLIDIMKVKGFTMTDHDVVDGIRLTEWVDYDGKMTANGLTTDAKPDSNEFVIHTTTAPPQALRIGVKQRAAMAGIGFEFDDTPESRVRWISAFLILRLISCWKGIRQPAEDDVLRSKTVTAFMQHEGEARDAVAAIVAAVAPQLLGEMSQWDGAAKPELRELADQAMSIIWHWGQQHGL